MFTILHGDNIVASRNVLQMAKKMAREKEVLVFDGKKVNLTDLKQALEARSLFGQEKLVVIENLISKNKEHRPKASTIGRSASGRDRPLDEKNRILNYLKALPADTDLILWEGKKIDGRVFSPFKNAKVQLFKTPAIIFKFLESIRPGNQKMMLSLLENCAKTEPIELIFYMIVRQFRQLLLVKDLGKKGVTRLASWQYSRLTNQADCFTLDKLLKIYKKLLEIDWQQKTGQTAFDLKRAIELLLINLG